MNDKAKTPPAAGSNADDDQKAAAQLAQQPIGSGSGTAGTLGSAPPWKKAPGNRVKVLDWSRDPQAPVECDGTITKVNDDGSIDVDVHPPVGIEPYGQTGLTECTIGTARPGQWKRPT